MKIWQIGLIILFMVGCGAQWKGVKYVSHDERGKRWEMEVMVDERLMEGQRGIQEGIAGWNWSMNGNGEIRVVDWEFKMEVYKLKGGGWKILDGSLMERPMDGNGVMILAWVNEIGGDTIYIMKDRVKGDMMKGVIMHEIGHLMGLTHKEGGLMNRLYESGMYGCVDRASAEEVEEARMWEGMNYCERN